jgi:MFS family permease
VIELGALGMIGAVVFWWLADEEPGTTPSARRTANTTRLFPKPARWIVFITAAFCFSLRDFGGSGFGSLGSLFLQEAHGLDPKHTGLLLSAIFLAAAISNPIFGHLSDGGRKRWITLVLVTAALLVCAFPHVPGAWLGLMLAAYGFFFMGSYPMVEAMLMESVPDAVRGRVFGLWITIGGLVGNLSHWYVGHAVKQLGSEAHAAAGYFSVYALLAAMIGLAILGLPCLHALRSREVQLGQTPDAVPATPR